jgi:hypothetical protein
MGYKHRGGNYMSDKNMVGMLKEALSTAEGLRTSLMSNLNADQRIIYNEFEKNYAMLLKNGDIYGMKKLEEKFKQDLHGSV